jgi:hypothetical protein
MLNSALLLFIVYALASVGAYSLFGEVGLFIVGGFLSICFMDRLDNPPT